MSKPLYDEGFFAQHNDGSRKSARETIPLIFEFLRPTSVVDVGCGTGTWLAEFKAAGISDYLGIDGDYVDRAKLLIEPARFLARDLTISLALDRRFDLAISLEVAEHLPDASAATFVESLTRLAPVVLFSAAIPGQDGRGHINEQWPDYWQRKFLSLNYVVADCLRSRLWNNADIEPWYRQNAMFFVERQRLADYPRLASVVQQSGAATPLSLVHPETYLEHYTRLSDEVRGLKCIGMRYALHLRDVNLLAFPDWQKPREQLIAQLRTLLTVLAGHPAHPRITVVLNVGNQPPQAVQLAVREAARDLTPPGATTALAGPEISAVDQSFGPDQWDILLQCIQGRVALPSEDIPEVARAGVDQLQVLTLAGIQAGQLVISS